MIKFQIKYPVAAALLFWSAAIPAQAQSQNDAFTDLLPGCVRSASDCVTLVDKELNLLRQASLSDGRRNAQVRALAASVIRAAREKAAGNENSQYSIALEKIAAAATNANLGRSVGRAASAIASERSNSFLPVPPVAASPS